MTTQSQAHLAVCLIDAIQDQNLQFVVKLILEKNADPNTLIEQGGYSPLHYAVGFEDTDFGLRVLDYFLAHGGDANVRTRMERYTPLHIACMNCRDVAVRVLLENGADHELEDAEGNTPMHYAVLENRFDLVRLIRTTVYLNKLNKKKFVKKPLTPVQKLTVPDLDSTKNLTPSRIIYNFDKTSPYYVNITHRRRYVVPEGVKSPGENVNVFNLTEENLAAFSENLRESGKFKLMDQWRAKIETHRSRKSYLDVLDDIEEHLGESEEKLESYLLLTDDSTDQSFKTARTSATYTVGQGQIHLPIPGQTETPAEEFQIKSPLKRKTMTLLQVFEEFQHSDEEEQISFKELKFLPITDSGDRRSTVSTFDDFRLDVDYDTDALRQELKQFGDSPGPITKSTKKFYVRRLLRYKRNPEHVVAKPRLMSRVYSLELEKTFRAINDGINCFQTFMKLEAEMIERFHATPSKQLREGNRKMSFIYLLLDPRALNNLAAEHLFLPKLEVWQRFLRAIFYIGKGKLSRPYAHLYEAIRCFHETQAIDDAGKHRSKLNRILDIWKDRKGVVCLHVFHNLIPSEAYTREAAMIDAMGLPNLTNLKKGDYYGVVQSWTMRQRKELGVALLGKALHIHLIEGESQISPTDLV